MTSSFSKSSASGSRLATTDIRCFVFVRVLHDGFLVSEEPFEYPFRLITRGSELSAIFPMNGNAIANSSSNY